MVSRLNLHSKFEETLDSENVYFQPPESIRMQYPAIVYKLNNIDTLYADDINYRIDKEYIVTLIDPDPDSIYVDLLKAYPKCKFNRFYTYNNLNHWVFIIK